MQRGIFEIFLVVLLLWPVSAPAAGLRVIVFGDSLVSGYQLQPEEAFAAQLDHKLKETGYYYVQVQNVAVDTTVDALQQLPSVLAQHPDLVVLSVGTTDAMRGYSIERIYKYAATIVQQLSGAQIYVVILGPSPSPSMGDDYAARLDRAFRLIATHYKGVQIFPASQGIAGQPDLSLADGVHPNARGVEAMVNGAFPLIDGGLRWKLEVQRYQQQYQQNSHGGDLNFIPKGDPPKPIQ